MSNVNNILINSAVCFIPLFIFIMVEMFYDKKYFFKYFFRKTPNKRIPFIIQYLIILIIAVAVFMYNHYLMDSNKILLDNENDNNLTTESLKKTKEVIFFGILLFIFVLFATILYSTFTKNKIKGIVVFFIYSVIGLCKMSYIYEKIRIFKDSKMKTKISMSDFLNKGIKINTDGKDEYVKAGMSTIIPGLVFGLVFGFIDNAGLISGLEALDSPFGVISRFMTGASSQKGGSANLVAKEMMEGTTSGLGNLFSDGLGVSLGAFFGKLASSIFPSKVQQPIWVDMVGISLGCILGIAIPLSIKNATNGNMWANGIMSFRFIKDFFIISVVITCLVMALIYIPDKGKKELE